MKQCLYTTQSGKQCEEPEAGLAEEYCSDHLPRMDAIEVLYKEMKCYWREEPEVA